MTHDDERRAKEAADLHALLARYDLRDGDRPDQPYSGNPAIGRGWFGILKELVEDLIKLGWDRKVAQIKEKFGSLRLYPGHWTPEFQDRIIAAREHSKEICEECGKAGTLRARASGWHATRCDQCWEADERARRARVAPGGDGGSSA